MTHHHDPYAGPDADYDIRPPARSDRDLRLAAHAVYALYAATFFSGVTILIGLLIAYLKRKDARYTLYESHLQWAINTFWIGLIVGIVATILSVVLIGIPIFILLALWFIYRIVKGWLRLMEERPIDHPGDFC